MNRLNIIIFFIVLFLLFSVNLLSTSDEQYSKLENRELASFPEATFDTFFSGEMMEGVSNYFSDRFILRDQLLQINSSLSQYKGVKQEVVIASNSGNNMFERQYAIKEENATNTHLEELNPFEIPPEPTQRFIEPPVETEGRFLIVNSSAMQVFRENVEAAKYYAEMVNHLNELLDDVEVYSLVVPTPVEFERLGKYSSLTGSQRVSFAAITEALDKDIIEVNVYEELKSKANDYIYYRTDHHWTPEGAFIAYSEFIKSTGETPLELSDFTVSQVGEFLGSTYGITLNKTLENNPDTLEYYLPKDSYKFNIHWTDLPIPAKIIDLTVEGYSIFLGGDFPMGHIQTQNANGKKLLVIKDSFGNAFMPFLIPHYADIYFIDPRLYKGNVIALVKSKEIEEVLVLSNIHVTSFSAYSDLILDLMD